MTMLLSQLIDPVPDPFCTPQLISCRSNEKTSVGRWILLAPTCTSDGGPLRLIFFRAASTSYVSSSRISFALLFGEFKRYTVWDFRPLPITTRKGAAGMARLSFRDMVVWEQRWNTDPDRARGNGSEFSSATTTAHSLLSPFRFVLSARIVPCLSI